MQAQCPTVRNTWNGYPCVLNDPLTLVDPLGADPEDYDPYFVGCFPDPFFESLFGGFGCGWDPENDPCPPGFEAIYGDPRSNRDGGPAIANLRSLHDYANAVLPWGDGYGDLYNYALSPNGVEISFDPEFFTHLQSAFQDGAEAIAIEGIVFRVVVIAGIPIATVGTIAGVAAIAGVIIYLAVQSNEILEEAKRQIKYRGPSQHRQLCLLLEEWYDNAGSAVERLKIYQAMKFAKCQRRGKRGGPQGW